MASQLKEISVTAVIIISDGKLIMMQLQGFIDTYLDYYEFYLKGQLKWKFPLSVLLLKYVDINI